MSNDQRPNKTKPCPGCGNLLLEEGTLNLDQEIFTIFSCDSCQMDVGEGLILPLTFGVDEYGRMIDPQNADKPIKIIRMS